MGLFRRRRKNTSDKGSGSHCAENKSLPILITGLFTNTFTDLWIVSYLAGQPVQTLVVPKYLNMWDFKHSLLVDYFVDKNY